MAFGRYRLPMLIYWVNLFLLGSLAFLAQQLTSYH